MASLLLGAILVFSILSIHTVLLKERQRIENIEQQILTQQQQWSEIWVKSREEDQAKAAARAAEADTNAQMIIEKVQEIAEAGPVDEVPAGSQAPISDEVVEGKDLLFKTTHIFWLYSLTQTMKDCLLSMVTKAFS